MILKIPDFYKEFQCTAAACENSCCMNWEIGIDKESYDYYKSIPGKFGDKLRQNMKEGQDPHFKMKHGQCPFLEKTHLCEIYEVLGEEALCEVCTEYPRFETEYLNIREKVLALSCEEAGRLLFTRKEPVEFLDIEMPGELEDTVRQTKVHKNEIIKARNHIIKLLQDRTDSMEDRIKQMLAYTREVQNKIQPEFNKNSEECKITGHAKFQKIMDVMVGLGELQEEWTQEVNNMMRIFYNEKREEIYLKTTREFTNYMKERSHEYEHLLVYFIYRYVIAAVFDEEIYEKVLFCLLCYRTIQEMGKMHFFINGGQFSLKDQIYVTRVFCKETEHSMQCISYLEHKIKSGEVTEEIVT